jgi:hypothetical protein
LLTVLPVPGSAKNHEARLEGECLSVCSLKGFGQLERRALYRGIFTSVDDLKTAIRRYIKVHNEKLAKPFRWHKSAESIMTSVTRAKLSVIDNK